jgi:hypothetical protein
MAYEEVALSGYEFDVTPEETTSAMRQLDANMAEDEIKSIRLNYNFPAEFGEGDLEDASGIPDAAVSYAALRLAKAMCSRMGKTLSAEARNRLTDATGSVLTLTARIPTIPYGVGAVAGAGNRRWGPFLTRGNC